jgi:RNA polymerase sigma-70 factor (ECF subfamily)
MSPAATADEARTIEPAHADPESSREESSLVEAARRGDRAAFARLHERYAPVIHGILLARVSHADADDLAQDVFLKAMRRLATLRDPGAFGGWIAAFARNAATDLGRRRRKERVLAAVPASAIGADDGPGRREEATRALDAIRSLPDAYRETLILRLVEGLTGPEIAQRTGMTHGSVRVNLHRGMQLIREKLGLEVRP